MADGPVQLDIQDSVAWLRLDDGKANAISLDVLKAAHEALDQAERDANCVVLLGRPGRFSAGFDLNVMRQGGEATRELVAGGARLGLRLYGFPIPVIAGCTGHALAMGALLLLSTDLRIGVEGEFKLGLNEVAIGMTLPVFGVELARERLSKRHLQRAVASAELYDPAGAVDAGYLDRVVPADALEDVVRKEAAALAALPREAHAGTKLRLRGEVIARAEASLAKPL
ncbi:MAG: crotonase/enoyl-CoA hydratase family protein [Proteobacteria bacterium]|nr:crotonase/enoyl-CoA hydratase family protein [Pseudomonadota bacterium]